MQSISKYSISSEPVSLKPGYGRTPEYKAWQDMKDRCHNPRSHAYRHYGGRSINVCPEWRKSFLAFYAHVGPRPGKGYSVERIDNDGNYEPGNVKWATTKEQSRNRRGCHFITYQGMTLTVSD
jgi:hypothetical protein